MDTNFPSSPRSSGISNSQDGSVNSTPHAPVANMIQGSGDTQDMSCAQIASFNANSLEQHLDPDGQISMESWFGNADMLMHDFDTGESMALNEEADGSVATPPNAAKTRKAGDPAHKADVPSESGEQPFGQAQDSTHISGDGSIGKDSNADDMDPTKPADNTLPALGKCQSTSNDHLAPAKPTKVNPDVTIADLETSTAGNIPPNRPKSPKVKYEEPEPLDDWKQAMQSITINLDDSEISSDDDNSRKLSAKAILDIDEDTNAPTSPIDVDDDNGDGDVLIVEDGKEVPIKMEDDIDMSDWPAWPEVQVKWSMDHSGVIEVEDSEDEATKKKRLLLERLRKAGDRGQRSPAETARIREMQRRLVAKTMGNSARLENASKAADLSGENAWMWQKARSAKDDAAAAKFLSIKRAYRAKCRKGQATPEDQFKYDQAEKAESRRLRLVELEIEQAIGNDFEDSGSGLFFLEPSSKRPIDGTGDERIQKKPRKQRPKDSGNRTKADFNKDLMESMLAGLPAALGKGDVNIHEDGSVKRANVKQFYKSRKKKTIQQGLSAQANAKGQKKKGNVKGFQPPRKSNTGKYTNGMTSLLTSNVYEDANAAQGRDNAPMSLGNEKSAAMRKLLASLDLTGNRRAAGEKEHILEMGRVLGNVKVSSDNMGWMLKGMKHVLHHHQIQGAGAMKDREIQGEIPQGGILADEMGFGKTVMTIMAIIANPAKHGEKYRSTLIVCSPSLISQWDREIKKHVDIDGLEFDVMRYDSKLDEESASSARTLRNLANCNIVLATYQEVLKSYPRPELMTKTNENGKNLATSDANSASVAQQIGDDAQKLETDEEKLDKWKKTWDSQRGYLHQIHFYRVVLDEAQAIKNHKGATSIACQGLMAKHRWVMSGTPIMNEVEELYPYFKFLRAKNIGSFRDFKQNFCKPDSAVCYQRLHTFLNDILIRRTYQNRLFERPIIQLPKNHQETIYIEFNKVERLIYETIRMRFKNAIKKAEQQGKLKKRRHLVLNMFTRLRQMTAHIFMLQETMEKMYEIEDIERLYRLTNDDVSKKVSAKNMVENMRAMIQHKDDSPESTPELDDDDSEAENEAPIVFKFRKYLRDLVSKSNAEEMKERGKCHMCDQSPDEPWVTSCMHLYCRECLIALSHDAAKQEMDQAKCIVCGDAFTGSEPCHGMAELQADYKAPRPKKKVQYNASGRPHRKPNDNMKWVDMAGQLLPSTKTAAAEEKLEQWLKEDDTTKIVLFTQFQVVMKVFAKICERRDWKFCSYDGSMSHQTRDEHLKSFKKNKDIRILVASLRCGGIGLNLTEASKVIIIDLWFNTCVEQQAFCRIFRIGQESETYLTRFVVKDTVDEQLLKMQERKDKVISAAMDNRTVMSKLTFKDMLYLFGEDIPYDHGEEDFVYSDVEDDDEEVLDPRSSSAIEEDPVAWDPCMPPGQA